jgi:hypothetical protein
VKLRGVIEGEDLNALRRTHLHPSSAVVIVHPAGAYGLAANEHRKHFAMATHGAVSGRAFAFFDGAEVGGLDVEIVGELGDAILVPGMAAVIE